MSSKRGKFDIKLLNLDIRCLMVDDCKIIKY